MLKIDNCAHSNPQGVQPALHLTEEDITTLVGDGAFFSMIFSASSVCVTVRVHDWMNARPGAGHSGAS
jgi:hypothetical protein